MMVVDAILGIDFQYTTDRILENRQAEYDLIPGRRKKKDMPLPKQESPRQSYKTPKNH